MHSLSRVWIMKLFSIKPDKQKANTGGNKDKGKKVNNETLNYNSLKKGLKKFPKLASKLDKKSLPNLCDTQIRKIYNVSYIWS